MRAILVFLAIGSIEGRSFSNDDSLSIHKYAKVARWGSNESNATATVQLGRSNSGHVPWPHSSSVNGIRSKQPKENVVKHFPVYVKPSSRVDNAKVENIPGIGEVIQDRFNIRPAFSYTQIPPRNEDSATYGPPKVSTAPPSFPAVFNVAPAAAAASAKPPVDLYTSPYSSYNPPNMKPNSDSDSYAAPPASDDGGPYAYTPLEPPKPTEKPPSSSVTLGPPLSPYSEMPSEPSEFHSHDYHGLVDAYPSDHEDVSVPKQSNGGDMPPNEPPKSIDDVYYPPDFPEDQKSTKAVDDMTADLNPPVSSHDGYDHDHGHDHQFPKYLYDDPHFDHHVYEEVPHPTTTEATEKRVSSTHYSYYYLGRKLWYIPLYFSIYFMVYVTALILKSIARHKVDLRDEWATSHSRSARQVSMDTDALRTVDHLHRNVTAAIDAANKLYNNAM